MVPSTLFYPVVEIYLKINLIVFPGGQILPKFVYSF